MTIGSHTRTHRALDMLTEDDLASELEGARLDLERELGESVWAISYPVGRGVSELPRIRAAVAEAGYQVGFTYRTGVQRTRTMDPLNVSRLAVESYWDRALFSVALVFPRLG